MSQRAVQTAQHPDAQTHSSNMNEQSYNCDYQVVREMEVWYWELHALKPSVPKDRGSSIRPDGFMISAPTS